MTRAEISLLFAAPNADPGVMSLKTTKGGDYFLEELKRERTRILYLAEQHEIELRRLQGNPATALSKEMNGVVRAAVGKARLLATKKFNQFEGLCLKNLNPRPDGPQTLTGDLLGFWEMTRIQIDEVDHAFREIQKYRDNGWVTGTLVSPKPKSNRSTKRPLTQSQVVKAKNVGTFKKPSTAPSDAALKRKEQRKRTLEMKRMRKAALKHDGERSAKPGNVSESGKENEEIF